MKKFKVRQLFLISKGRDDGCINRNAIIELSIGTAIAKQNPRCL